MMITKPKSGQSSVVAAKDLAVQIGSSLPVNVRQYFVAGLEPLRELDPYMAGQVAQAIGVNDLPPLAKRFRDWFDACLARDDPWQKEIEGDLMAAGEFDAAQQGAAAVRNLLLLVMAPATPAQISFH